MAKISRFATDPNKELTGVWLPMGGGIEVLVARLGNPEFNAFVTRTGKALGPGVRSGNVDPKDAEDLTKRAVAKHVLLGWKNLEDDDDQPIPFSSEKALEIFNEFPEFFRSVMNLASDVDNFRRDVVEAAKGNS